MRKKITIILLQTLLINLVYGNVDCIWSSSKNGIFIEYEDACKQSNRLLIDSILNEIVTKLQRTDTTLKLEIYVNSEDVFYRETGNSNYVSISYDVLGKLKNNEIFDYYYDKQMKNIKFDTRKTPLNINYKKEDQKNKGLKIIFNTDYRYKIEWVNLFKLIDYAVKNIETIKANQKLDTIGFCCNYYFVSILTIDSTKISEIVSPKKYNIQRSCYKTIYLILGIILIPLLFLIKKLKFQK